jgi:four helix bundle protein
MTGKEMVIFTRTYDFITWLMPLTEKFPRTQRFVVTQHLQNSVLCFQETIVEANFARGKKRLEKLYIADAELLKVRIYLRLCNRWQWLSNGQYRHASGMVTEMGNLLGGWIQVTS